MKSRSKKLKSDYYDSEDEEEDEGEGEIEDVLPINKPQIIRTTVVQPTPQQQAPPCNVQNFRCIQPQFVNEFPQRSVHHIPDSKIVIRSDFCSGNLTRAYRGNQKNHFDLWVAADSEPHFKNTDFYRTWFYFSITGVPQGEQLTFTFKNLHNQSKLYSQGLKPVFRVVPTAQTKWRRVIQKVTYWFNQLEDSSQFILQFSHTFSYSEDETTYFAFTFPFSYQESIEQMDQVQLKLFNQPNVYFQRDTLCYSLEGRKVEVITISSRDGLTEELETQPESDPLCFPDGIQSQKFASGKKVVFLTSRVHPGETPGSHVLNGFIQLLTDLKNEQARCLRKNFVFKIIPMLNPDGVSRGYYRLDTKAYNLNRYYANPVKQDHPTIWAVKKLITQHAHEYKNLFMYVDFHAHASKKSGFMFGNYLQDQQRQADNITFAKLVAMNCLNFDMTECNFSDRIMSIKDRNGQSREGSSRVALHMATGITYCYTLEFNYHSGKRINTLAQKYVKATSMIEAETPVTDPGSKIYNQCASPPFTQDIFEDCGRAFGAALLDLIDDNPVSRIPLSCYKSVQNVRTDVLQNLDKYQSGNASVVGSNNFAATNQKVAKIYADTKGPKVKASSASIGKEIPGLSNLVKPQGGKSTFGTTKRLTDDKMNSAKPKSPSNSQPRNPPLAHALTSQPQKLPQRQQLTPLQHPTACQLNNQMKALITAQQEDHPPVFLQAHKMLAPISAEPGKQQPPSVLMKESNKSVALMRTSCNQDQAPILKTLQKITPKNQQDQYPQQQSFAVQDFLNHSRAHSQSQVPGTGSSRRSVRIDDKGQFCQGSIRPGTRGNTDTLDPIQNPTQDLAAAKEYQSGNSNKIVKQLSLRHEPQNDKIHISKKQKKSAERSDLNLKKRKCSSQVNTQQALITRQDSSLSDTAIKNEEIVRKKARRKSKQRKAK